MSKSTQAVLAGPRKLICIHAGTCDYAELDITEPIQLVAANNVGKTAVISTLQFLYLDEARSLDFGSHDLATSKQFYFPKPTSYIIFECDTAASGVITICMRSAGPTAGYDFERYWFRGPYQREDFLNEHNQPRVFEQVKLRLADREFLKVEDYAAYRSLLGAVDHRATHSWGLVPLEDAKQYAQFKKTFQRLLQLRDLNQEQLKDLLADCAGLRSSEREIDLAKDSNAQLVAIEKNRLEIQLLETAQEAVKEARALYRDEVQARANAHVVAARLHERCAHWNEEYQRCIKALNDEADVERLALDKLRLEKQGLERNRDGHQQKLGQITERLEAVEKGRQMYATFQVDLAEQSVKNLKETWLQLDSRLRSFPKESLEEIRARLATQEAQLTEIRRQESHQSKLIVTWLRTQLPADDVNRLGALFRAEVLESIRDEQLTVKDAKVFIDNLRAIARRCDARCYEDDAAIIEFPAGALRRAEELGQIERIQRRRSQMELNIEKTRKDIDTIVSLATLKQEAQEREVAYKAAENDLLDFKAWREECLKEPRWLEDKATHEVEIARLAAELDTNESKRTASQGILTSTGIRAVELGKANNFITQQIVKGLPVADGDDPRLPLAEGIELPGELKDWFKIVRQHCDAHRNGRIFLNSKIGALDSKFGAASFGYDPSMPVNEKLEKIETEIDALEERRRETDNQWLGVLRTSRASFTQILNSLHSLQKKCHELNRQFNQLEFSSIRKIELKLYEHEAELSVFRRFRDQGGDPSLFDAPEEADKRFQTLRDELQRRPKLQLSQLFGLRFEVTRNDGAKNPYDRFEQVESTGTTVVLKVVLNLIVLKDLLVGGKARIPFHLDEVLELDHHNLANILKLSEELGFVGIFAAPEFAVGPRVFVHMVPNEAKRLIIDERHRQEIIEEPAVDSTPVEL